MPSLRDPMVDERFDDLVAAIRAARPAASSELQERVAEIARSEPAPARRRSLLTRPRLRSRRLVPALLAGALLAAAVAGAIALGNRGGDQQAVSPEAPQSLEARPAEDASGGGESGAEAGAAVPESAPATADVDDPGRSAAAPPAGGRLTDYRVGLTLRVEDLAELSSATNRAMRIARTLGGYVVSASYAAPEGGEGDSRLVLRVPVSRVQEAIARLSALGTIASQDIALQDLQRTANQQQEAIDTTRSRLAALRRELAKPGLGDEEKALLQARIAGLEDELARLRQAREETVGAGSLARIALTLTTRGPGEAATPPGELEQVLRDALDLLARVSVWTLAVLLVSLPFLVLAGAALVVARRMRRRADERLLERS